MIFAYISPIYLSTYSETIMQALHVRQLYFYWKQKVQLSHIRFVCMHFILLWKSTYEHLLSCIFHFMIKISITTRFKRKWMIQVHPWLTHTCTCELKARCTTHGGLNRWWNNRSMDDCEERSFKIGTSLWCKLCHVRHSGEVFILCLQLVIRGELWLLKEIRVFLLLRYLTMQLVWLVSMRNFIITRIKQ